jgi:hypothetical protein
MEDINKMFEIDRKTIYWWKKGEIKHEASFHLQAIKKDMVIKLKT